MNRPPPIDDERVSAYLDGELPQSERRAFEELLAQREDYRQAVEELRAVSEAVRALPKMGLSADFSRRVLGRAEREMLTAPVDGSSVTTAQTPLEPAATRRRLWPLAAIAAALLLMLCLPFLLEWQNPEPARLAQLRDDDTGADAEEPAAAFRELGAADVAPDSLSDRLVEESAEPAASMELLTGRDDDLAEVDRTATASGADVVPHSGDASPSVASTERDRRSNFGVEAAPYERLAGRELEAGDNYDAVANVELGQDANFDVFLTTLVRNQIELQPTPLQPGTSAAPVLQPMARARAENDKAEEKGTEAAIRSKQKEDAEMAGRMAEAAELEIQRVYVEATPKDLQNVMADLRSQSFQFEILTAQEAADGERRIQWSQPQVSQKRTPATQSFQSRAVQLAPVKGVPSTAPQMPNFAETLKIESNAQHFADQVTPPRRSAGLAGRPTGPEGVEASELQDSELQDSELQDSERPLRVLFFVRPKQTIPTSSDPGR